MLCTYWSSALRTAKHFWEMTSIAGRSGSSGLQEAVKLRSSGYHFISRHCEFDVLFGHVLAYICVLELHNKHLSMFKKVSERGTSRQIE